MLMPPKMPMPAPVAPMPIAAPIQKPMPMPAPVAPMPIAAPVPPGPSKGMPMPTPMPAPPMLPPKREDFMSIGGPGGGRIDERVYPGGSADFNERGPTFVPPAVNQPIEGNNPPIPTAAPAPAAAPVTTNTNMMSNQSAPTASSNMNMMSNQAAMQPQNMPFASGIRQVASGLDPLTEQLLFGIGGQGGFIPGAMRAAERTFYDEEGNPIVIDEQVAGFSPDQIAAIEMQRQALGLQDPYIQDARAALQASMQAYDPSITGQFFNPYEDEVVQQTIQDVMEQGAKSDIGALAGDIARGGQSAFGSRARLGAEERQRALGRGLAEAIGGLRSRGFSEAQQRGLAEFARQRAAQRAGASGIAGLGAQAAGASLSDIGALYGMGTQQQNQLQRLLDAERRNLQQYQMTPLMQYQALAPFISMAPAGQFQTVTDFAPRPSAMQAGLGTGLAAFGALGNFFNQGG